MTEYKTQTKISIVVPVYNAEAVLQTCVDSILGQSFTEWELLLVDDGSGDASGALCDRLSQEDSRIRAYHKPNGGVSSARNLGIRKARGEYLYFADSDDTLVPETLAELYREASAQNADMVVCGFTYYVEQSGETVDNVPEKFFCGGGAAYLRERFLVDFRQEFFNPPWNKLILRSLLTENGIFFGEEYAICEDMAFSMQVLERCHRICVLPRALYCYHYKEADNLVNRFHANYYEALLYFRDCARHCFDRLGAEEALYGEIDAYFVGKSLMFLHKIYRDSGYDRQQKRTELERIGASVHLQNALREYRATGRRRVLRGLLLHRNFFMLDELYRWR